MNNERYFEIGLLQIERWWKELHERLEKYFKKGLLWLKEEHHYDSTCKNDRDNCITDYETCETARDENLNNYNIMYILISYNML